MSRAPPPTAMNGAVLDSLGPIKEMIAFFLEAFRLKFTQASTVKSL